MLLYFAILLVLALAALGYLNHGLGACVAPLIFGSIIVGLATLITWGAIKDSKQIDATRTEAWHVDLVKLKNKDSFEGRFFFLGSGWIAGNEVYVYMYRTNNGDLKRGRQNAYRCTIRETDKQSPRRIVDKRFARILWLFPWEIRLPDSMPAFVVPPGTVVSLNHYEID